MLQNSIISLHEFYRGARGSQAIARGGQRRSGASLCHAVFDFFSYVQVRNSKCGRELQGCSQTGYWPVAPLAKCGRPAEC